MIKHSISLTPNQHGLWFVVNRGRIWVNAARQIPQGNLSALTLSAEPEQICRLGELAGQDAYLLINHDHIADDDEWVSPRDLLSEGEQIFHLAARAVQVALFLQTHRFCGQCGSAMSLVSWELAALCNKCGHRCYPRIAPCVLVGIVKDDKILLARSSRHRPGFFSILAGFVESAETLEQAAVREVKEEVGVDIANLRYVGSQPWPFPQSCMIGFTATSDDTVPLNVDTNELVSARWFKKSDVALAATVEGATMQLPVAEAALKNDPTLPLLIPPKGVIARKLIDKWLVD